MLAPVSSSPGLPHLGRFPAAAGAQTPLPPAADRNPTPQSQPTSLGEEDAEAIRFQISRARLSSQLLLPGSSTEPRGADNDAPHAKGQSAASEAATPEFRIPTRLTLEIQKAREAIAEAGGGLRAMQDYMRLLSNEPTPTLSISV